MGSAAQDSPGTWGQTIKDSPGTWGQMPKDSPGTWSQSPKDSPGTWGQSPNDSPGTWGQTPKDSQPRDMGSESHQRQAILVELPLSSQQVALASDPHGVHLGCLVLGSPTPQLSGRL